MKKVMAVLGLVVLCSGCMTSYMCKMTREEAVANGTLTAGGAPNLAAGSVMDMLGEHPVMGTLAIVVDGVTTAATGYGLYLLCDRANNSEETTYYNITSGRDTTIGDSNTTGADSHDTVMEGE